MISRYVFVTNTKRTQKTMYLRFPTHRSSVRARHDPERNEDETEDADDPNENETTTRRCGGSRSTRRDTPHEQPTTATRRCGSLSTTRDGGVRADAGRRRAAQRDASLTRETNRVCRSSDVMRRDGGGEERGRHVTHMTSRTMVAAVLKPRAPLP